MEECVDRADGEPIIVTTGRTQMTREEQQHLAELVKQIEVEQDQHKFIQLVEELNDLLDGKADRLEHTPPSPLNTTISQRAGSRQRGLGPRIASRPGRLLRCTMYFKPIVHVSQLRHSGLIPQAENGGAAMGVSLREASVAVSIAGNMAHAQ
jgi:hypothetical protein